MSNGSSGDFGDRVSRSRNWDHPNGLGWQVWRRAQSTGLLTQAIERDFARFRENTLRDRLPLLVDIQGRWALSRDSVVNRFGLSLPLLWAHPRIFRDSTSHDLPALAPLPLRPHSEPPVVSPAFEPSPLSAGTELPKEMTKKAGEWVSKEVVAQRNVQSSEPVDIKLDAVRVAPTITSLKQQRSGAGSPFNFVGPTTRTTREFGGDKFEPKAHEYVLMRRQRPAGRFIPSRPALLRPILMSQGLVRRDIQHLPLSTRSAFLSAVAGQQLRLISGSLHGADAKGQGTDRGVITTLLRTRSPSIPLIALARSNDFSAKMTDSLRVSEAPVRRETETTGLPGSSTQPSPFATTRPQSATDLSIEHRTLTTNYDVSMIRRKVEGPLPQRSVVGNIDVQRGRILPAEKARSPTAVRLPLSVDIWRDNKRISRSAQPADIKFSKVDLGFVFPSLASKAGSVRPVNVQGRDNQSAVKVAAAQSVAAALVRNMVDEVGAPPPSLANTITRRTALTTLPRLVASGEGKSSQERQGERGGAHVRDRYDQPSVIWQEPLTSSVSKVGDVQRLFSRIDSESDRAGYDSRAESNFQERLSPLRLFTSGDTMLHRFYSGPGVWVGHRVGDPRVSSSRTPLTQGHDAHGVPIYRSEEPASIASRIVISRRVSPIGGMGARTPAGMISLVNLPLNMAQTYVVPGQTRGGDFDVSGDAGASGFSWSGIAGSGFGAAENNSESGTVQRSFLLTDSWPTRRGANPTSTLSKGWLVTPSAPPLLRLSDVGPGRGQLPSRVRARDTALDMPLAPLPRTESRDDLTLHRVNGAVVQTSPLGSGTATGASGGAPTALVGGEEPKAIGTEKNASAAPIDVDEVVEKAWQKLILKLTIEQERRGYSRWS